MATPVHSRHSFACHLAWTGAARGGTTSYAAYSREHRVVVEGKPPLVASAAPPFRGDGTLHNPEDLLVAALASCHFLSYAALCARAGIELVGYEDDATGVMEPIDGVMRFREVLLRPRAEIVREEDRAKALALHAQAHAECFIANSVNFPVRHEATIVVR